MEKNPQSKTLFLGFSYENSAQPISPSQ